MSRLAVVADPSQVAALRARLEAALRDASASALAEGSAHTGAGIDAQRIARVLPRCLQRAFGDATTTSAPIPSSRILE